VPQISVNDLAKEADLDLDEVLVALWDVNLDLEDPKDIVPRSQLRTARTALGIDAPEIQKTVQYWIERLDTDRSGLHNILAELGLDLRPKVRTLPKGALRRLKRQYTFSPTIAEKTLSERDILPATPFEWHDIGRVRDIRHLHTVEVSPPGVKSEHLLESAMHRPRTSLGQSSKYPTVEMAAAALLHSLVLNHPFHNGNKRTGLVALLVFLDRNNFVPRCDEQDLFRFVLKVAQHGLVPYGSDDLADREVLAIAQWIQQNSRLIARGERQLPWHRVKRILRQFDCRFDSTISVGNRMNIYRTVAIPRRLVRSRSKELSVQVHYSGEGTEVQKNTLHHIRSELRLGEEDGIDSEVFYGSESEPDDFIQQYRTLLRRLGKL
jgi:death-on-curing family protein